MVTCLRWAGFTVCSLIQTILSSSSLGLIGLTGPVICLSFNFCLLWHSVKYDGNQVNLHAAVFYLHVRSHVAGAEVTAYNLDSALRLAGLIPVSCLDVPMSASG
jgi:hypothetical protein